jgi:fumarate reductase flavoprotein subunit
MKSEEIALEADLVIIGSGGAGLTAAVAAAEKGAGHIIVLEKRAGLGGNSARAWGIFAAESPAQKRSMIDCRKDDCFQIAMRYAHWSINPRLVRAFIDKSGDTIGWLEEKGLKFDCIPFYPNQIPTWHIPKGRGAKLIKVLTEECKKRGVELLSGTPAKKILTGSKGEVTGVLAASKEKEYKIITKSVIVASGGYAGNKKLLKKYSPNYRDNMPCVGIPHAGDGLAMATDVGAETEGLGIIQMGGPTTPDNVQLKLGTPPNTFRVRLMAFALEPNTIWINKKGERFIDESVGFHHYESSNAAVRQPDNVTYTLFDSKMLQRMTDEGLILGMGLPEGARGNRLHGLDGALRALVDKGLVKVSESLEDMAECIGAEPAVLKETMAEYNAACDQGSDSIFVKDRKYLVPIRIAPYYAIKCHADFMNTIGGIKINEHMEVLGKEDNPIPGLYGAGVDVGGWQSDTYCAVLSGSAFGFAVNSGRIAGENSAGFVLAQ